MLYLVTIQNFCNKISLYIPFHQKVNCVFSLVATGIFPVNVICRNYILVIFLENHCCVKMAPDHPTASDMMQPVL